MSNSIGLKSMQRQLPCCLEHRLQRAHAMLSLSEVVPCYESRVIKAWLNCLESERIVAGAAIGSIASIFDVSVVNGRRWRLDRRSQVGSTKEGSRDDTRARAMHAASRRRPKAICQFSARVSSGKTLFHTCHLL